MLNCGNLMNFENNFILEMKIKIKSLFFLGENELKLKLTRGNLKGPKETEK